MIWSAVTQGCRQTGSVPYKLLDPEESQSLDVEQLLWVTNQYRMINSVSFVVPLICQMSQPPTWAMSSPKYGTNDKCKCEGTLKVDFFTIRRVK